jgi:hypothetical protein
VCKVIESVATKEEMCPMENGIRCRMPLMGKHYREKAIAEDGWLEAGRRAAVGWMVTAG